MLFDVSQVSWSAPVLDCCPAATSMCCSTQVRSGIARNPPPSGEFAGVGGPAATSTSRSQERTNSPGSPIAVEHGDVHLGAVVALDVVDQLVHVVRERVLRVRALVELGQHVAVFREDGRPGAPELHVEVVLPLHLVAEVVLVPRVRRIGDGQHLVGVAERQAVGVAVEVGAVRIAPVLVAEAAAARAGRRVPGRIHLPIRAQDRVGVVLLLGAAVERARVPDPERAGRGRAARIHELIG